MLNVKKIRGGGRDLGPGGRGGAGGTYTLWPCMSGATVPYHPQPPPLCKATQVAPRNASPMQFCTAISKGHEKKPLQSITLIFIRNCWTEMLARSLGHIIILVHF
jgi:hypothetical protein